MSIESIPLEKTILFVGEIDKFGLNCPQSSLQSCVSFVCLAELHGSDGRTIPQSQQIMFHLGKVPNGFGRWRKLQSNAPVLFFGRVPNGCAWQKMGVTIPPKSNKFTPLKKWYS